MAADVSTGINGDEKKKELVTRDLLGDKELWEKNFELLSRNSNCSQELKSGPVSRELHDLNLPPPPAPSFASVCTLEKVKSALERAMRVPNPSQNPNPKSSGGSHLTSKKRALEKEPVNGRDESGSGWGSGMVSGGSMMLTVCPGCFQYLLVPKVDPRCPRCDSHVPFPKKAKLVDLNCSTSSPNNN